MQRHTLTIAKVLIEDRHRVAAADRRARQFRRLDPATSPHRPDTGPSSRTATARRVLIALTRARAIAGLTLAILGTPMLAVAAVATSGAQADLGPVRQATAAFHDLSAAEAAGYVPFYLCTDEAGVGAMGQHFVNPELVGDPAIDPLHPEVLVYEPRSNGGYKLVALEYVTFQDAWAGAFGATTPSVLGVELKAVAAPNRYGLPPFFQRHVWLWAPNPLGLFNDWNPGVTCRGTGDPA